MSDQIPQAKAAIFDLDGTLLDTLGDLADAVNVALSANGYPEHSEKAVCRFIGDGARMLLKRAMPEEARGDAEKLTACLASFEDHYGKHYADRTTPYPGILELLSELRLRGVPMGILSNKPHEFTIQCAESYFGENGSPFGVIFGQREGIPKKPDPAGALEAAEKLGVSPEDCIYVGDSDVDMQTALSAGMKAIGVGWGFREVEELRKAGAMAIVDTPGGILKAFELFGL